MTEKIRKILLDFLLEEDCIWKLAVLKAGDRLKDYEEFKDCYSCPGNKESCLSYLPYKPEIRAENKTEIKQEDIESTEGCFWKKISTNHESQRRLYSGFSKCYECDGHDNACKFYRQK